MNRSEDTVASIGPDGRVGGEEHKFFAAPSREAAYNFKVAVYCSWRPAHRRWPTRWRIEREDIAQVYEVIWKTVRMSTRGFSILESAAAEEATNANLVKALDYATHATTSIRAGWIARAEVHIPDEVVAVMRNAWEEEYKIEAKAKAAKLFMNTTSELRTGWDKFINDAAESKNAHHAVRLAEEPKNVAKVLDDVMQDRRKDTREFLTLIDKIVEAHRSADVLDLVVNSQSVLRKTLGLMGIPVGEEEADTLFEPLDADR
jgi:hypothetical protein